MATTVPRMVSYYNNMNIVRSKVIFCDIDNSVNRLGIAVDDLKSYIILLLCYENSLLQRIFIISVLFRNIQKSSGTL